MLWVFMRKNVTQKIRRERQSDEDSLYYILERDLDREAIVPEHDGWHSQVELGKSKRIDYVVRYGERIYGIEVKTGIPKSTHFVQAERYCNTLNGIFLAYPSDRVGEALYVSEKKQEYKDVGLISLTLFRSHVIRKAQFCQRQSEQVWINEFDEKKYRKWIASMPWERSDGLPATVLHDGCFWASYDTKGMESETCHRLPLTKSDWIGLGLLYASIYSTSLDRYFSIKYFLEKRKSLGWKGFSLWNLVMCDLADVRTYGDRLLMISLNPHAHFLESRLRLALKRKLGKKEWARFLEAIEEWRDQHKVDQEKHEKEFIEI